VKVLEGESLRRQLRESYSRNPKGWSFAIFPSRGHGFYDALVSGPDGAWMLKMDTIFKPSPLVLGSPTEDSPGPKTVGPFPYGYRNLPPELALQMLRGEDRPSRDEAVAGLLSVIRSQTVVPEEGKAYAEGPFVFTREGKSGLSESQRNLDLKLSSEMQRLLRTRYPAYG
jgi:hypothetical protein